MDFLNPVHTLIQCPVHGCSYGESTTNYGAETDEEARESLLADFAVYDLHW